VFVFNYRIQSAALLMSAAFEEAAVHDFDFAKTRSVSRRGSTTRNWYNSIVHNVVDCSRQVRNALVHEWRPTPRAERLAIDAFVILSDLTPARNELLRLCRYDRPRAFSELARHVELAADQFRLSADLLAEVEGASRPQELPTEVRFAEMARLLLQRAGGGLSLTEAAKLLGTSRQALHKRVKTGSALALMDGAELVLPKFQFVEDDDHTLILEGLAKIIKLFDASKAGRWSALQFLLEQDPNLGVAPIQTLRTGEVQQVVDAAAAYLDVDED
jgi:predicted transcriptional regulator